MKIPNGQRADLGRKLEEYVLNPLHRHGQHKARVFESALGITMANRHVLAAALLEASASSANAVAMGDNGFGQTFVLRFPLTTEAGSATVLSTWIIRDGEDFPRLTSSYIV